MINIDLKDVPNEPGIYIWKNSDDEIIYIGKAKRLKQRMQQYFRGMLNSYKTASLVEEISSFEYVISATDKEALILERNYIEKYSPKYNILLTDDKRYPYIQIELKDELAIRLVYRVKSVRGKRTELFGPYPTGYRAKALVNLLENIALYENGLPHKNKSHEFWQEKYDYVRKILTSGQKSLLNELKQKMMIASENLQFEVAQRLKEEIESLESSSDQQVVELNNNENFDAISFVELNGYVSISMLFYRAGSLLSKKEFIIQITNSLRESIEQFVSQYYSKNITPEYIISNFELPEFNITVPEKGKKKAIIEMAINNANDNIELKMSKFIRNEEMTFGSMQKLKTMLGIKKLEHILMMDNSNTNNTLPVSVIVSYRNGVKQKSEYRKYNLENNQRDADVEYMKQGIEKYFSKPENPVPDLFIVDGGLAQIHEAKKLLPDLKIIGLVKNDKHRTESLIDLNENKVMIDDLNLFNFLSGMQNEVDRFAKYHHNQRRVTQTLEGELIRIDGIGPSTEKKLLNHFQTYSAIYNAPLSELEKVVSKQQALNIKEKFNK